VIISRWSDITAVINELPSVAVMRDFYRKIGLPISAEEAGLDGDILSKVVSATRDIRDKYVITRLAFDMGITELYEVK
jgi:glycerol-1-phosphate dehydrogenase [NAD(P)+]